MYDILPELTAVQALLISPSAPLWLPRRLPARAHLAAPSPVKASASRTAPSQPCPWVLPAEMTRTATLYVSSFPLGAAVPPPLQAVRERAGEEQKAYIRQSQITKRKNSTGHDSSADSSARSWCLSWVRMVLDSFCGQ